VYPQVFQTYNDDAEEALQHKTKAKSVLDCKLVLQEFVELYSPKSVKEERIDYEVAVQALHNNVPKDSTQIHPYDLYAFN